jgi:hypothetical protein
MPGVVTEKFEALGNPRVEATLHVLCDLASDVFAVAKPFEFVSRRRRPDRLFTLFTVIAVSHPRSVTRSVGLLAAISMCGYAVT